jgi:predicted secreted protein
VEINVIYKYRGPEAPSKDATTIAYDTLEVENLNNILKTPLPGGEIVELHREDLEEQDEDPKEYMVVERYPVLVQVGSASCYTLSALTVIVTEPD